MARQVWELSLKCSKKSEMEQSDLVIFAPCGSGNVARQQSVERNFWGEVPAQPPLTLSACRLTPEAIQMWEDNFKALATRTKEIRSAKGTGL